MRALNFVDCAIRVDERGTWFNLLLDKPFIPVARQFVLQRKDRLYTAELKEFREKRSLDANSYYWRLCGDLARAINEKPEGIYLRHIKDIGNYSVLCVQEKALSDFERKWTSGHLGRFIETKESKIPGCVTVLAYYGSSDFDRREMSRLIDNIIQDCKAVGVETLPPDKLALLKEDWDAQGN